MVGTSLGWDYPARPPEKVFEVPMRICSVVASAVIVSLVWSSTAMAAPQHAVSPAAVRQAVVDQVSVDQTNRDAVVGLLHNAQVREVASRLGLDVTRAEGAVASLDSVELAALSDQARLADTQLAGGTNTLIISTTTLLLLIIIVILVAR